MCKVQHECWAKANLQASMCKVQYLATVVSAFTNEVIRDALGGPSQLSETGMDLLV